MIEKCNGFTILRVENDQSLRKKCYPIDIIFRPVLNWPEETIQCYFSIDIHLAYGETFNNGNKIKLWDNVFAVLIFMVEKISMKGIENCAGHPGIIYDFSIQNLVTFEDNLKYKGDLPLTAYIGFETTAPIDSCLNSQDRNMLLKIDIWCLLRYNICFSS